jgi:hypothetical protein
MLKGDDRYLRGTEISSNYYMMLCLLGCLLGRGTIFFPSNNNLKASIQTNWLVETDRNQKI